jgi:pentatricopeptide repeat protein
LFFNLLLKFQQSYKDALACLDAFLQAGDVDSALKLLHAMKGVAANLAMPELRSGIVALEQTLKAGSEYEPELLTDFANTLNRVLESAEQLRKANSQETEVLTGN